MIGKVCLATTFEATESLKIKGEEAKQMQKQV